MTDLSALIPPDSPFYLLEALGGINSRGQIAGIALVISTGEVHAVLLTPVLGAGRAASVRRGAQAQARRPKVTLSANVRNLLRSLRPRRFGARTARPK
jgi:hypothetical protein